MIQIHNYVFALAWRLAGDCFEVSANFIVYIIDGVRMEFGWRILEKMEFTWRLHGGGRNISDGVGLEISIFLQQNSNNRKMEFIWSLSGEKLEIIWSSPGVCLPECCGQCFFSTIPSLHCMFPFIFLTIETNKVRNTA